MSAAESDPVAAAMRSCPNLVFRGDYSAPVDPPSAFLVKEDSVHRYWMASQQVLAQSQLRSLLQLVW